MLALLKKIDRLILPRGLAEPYSPYVWLIYLPLFFAPVIYFHHSNWQLVATAAITLGFLLLYFHSYWVPADSKLWHIFGVVLLGVVAAFITPTACTLFIYASAMCHTLNNTRLAYTVLAIILATIALISWVFTYEVYFYLPALVFSLLTGITSIYQQALDDKKRELILSRQETQRLAKIAERERIARDLHDLIGHTFSVITLKADLAGRLLDKDLEKARNEIKQLETISRDALSQVREVVSGYRSSDLLSELANARHIFASMGVDFDYQLRDLKEAHLNRNMQLNKELAIVFRELVTNIIKHANASTVRVLVTKHQQGILLTVEDNGKGMPDMSDKPDLMGNGQRGIHERISKLQGWVKLNARPGQGGTFSQICVPCVDA